MYKKSIALLLVLLLAISILASCKKTEPTSSPTATPTVSATPTAAPSEPFPGADLKGVTLKVAGLQNPETADEAKKDMWRARQKAVEEKFNVKLVFDVMNGIEWNDIAKKINESIAAGDPIVDLYNASRYFIPELAIGDAVVDMTKEISVYNLPKLYHNEIVNWGDKAVGFLGSPFFGYAGLIYNRDLVKKAGMTKTPTDMFLEGKWNYNDFYNYCAELKTKLPAGVDVLGIHPMGWADKIAFGNGAEIMDPKTYVPAYCSDAMYTSIEVFQKLVANGLARKGTPVIRDDGSQGYDWNKVTAGFNEGQIVMTTGGPGAYPFDWGIVGPPWGPNVTISNNDYRTLSDNYGLSTPDAGIWVLIKGAEKKITPEQYMNLIFTYNEEQGKQLIIDREKEAKGEQLTPADAGTPRDFCTDQDVQIFDWLTARFKFEPMNSSAQSNVWFRALYKACYTNENIRSAFEAVVGQDTYAMVDAGLVKEENIPANIKAAYDAYAKTATPTPTK